MLTIRSIIKSFQFPDHMFLQTMALAIKYYPSVLFLLQKNTFQFLIASNGSASYGIWLFKKLETSFWSFGIPGYNFGSSYCQERFTYTNQQLLQMGVIVRLISHCSNSIITTRLPFTNFTEPITNYKRPTRPTPSVKQGQ